MTSRRIIATTLRKRTAAILRRRLTTEARRTGSTAVTKRVIVEVAEADTEVIARIEEIISRSRRNLDVAMRVVKQIFIVIASTVLTGCLAPQDALMVGVDVGSWRTSESVIYENSDSLALRDLNIALRYNSRLKERVLPLKIAVTTPDARYFEEVVELPIQHNGTFTVAKIASVPYRKDVVLGQKGFYIFTFEPTIEISGVEAIGVEFINTKR